MRGIFRVLFCLLLCGSLVLAAIPHQPLLPEIQKTDCCAKMKAKSHECDHEMPKPDQDQQCCAACIFGLAVILNNATPFVYPPVGDENFAAYILSEHFRSQRPPVPPPRA